MEKDEKYLKNHKIRPYHKTLTSLIEDLENRSYFIGIISETMLNCGELKQVMMHCDEILLKHIYMNEIFNCYGEETKNLFIEEKAEVRNRLLTQWNQDILDAHSIEELWKIGMIQKERNRRDSFSLKQKMFRHWEKVWQVFQKKQGSLVELALILYVNYWLYPNAKSYPELFDKLIHFYLREHSWTVQPFMMNKWIEMNEWDPFFKNQDDEEEIIGWVTYFISWMNEVFVRQLHLIERIQWQLDEDERLLLMSDLSVHAKQNLYQAFIYFKTVSMCDTITLSKNLKLSYNTSATIMNQLEKLQIISRVNYNQRNKSFYYRNYIENGLFDV